MKYFRKCCGFSPQPFKLYLKLINFTASYLLVYGLILFLFFFSLLIYLVLVLYLNIIFSLVFCPAPLHDLLFSENLLIFVLVRFLYSSWCPLSNAIFPGCWVWTFLMLFLLFNEVSAIKIHKVITFSITGLQVFFYSLVC